MDPMDVEQSDPATAEAFNVAATNSAVVASGSLANGAAPVVAGHESTAAADGSERIIEVSPNGRYAKVLASEHHLGISHIAAMKYLEIS